MSPDSFSFTIAVPPDARLLGVVRDLCAHAATYARLGGAARERFCTDVVEAATRAAASGGNDVCVLAFACEDGELRVRVAGEIVRQSQSA